MMADCEQNANNCWCFEVGWGENKGERGGWGDKESTKNKEEKLKEIKTRTETLTKEIDKYERKQIKRKKLIQRLRVKERKIQSW